MNKINEFIESFSFRDEIAKATVIKDEVRSGLEQVGLNSFDFSEDTPPAPPEETNSIPFIPVAHEPEEFYNAEENAASLVGMMTAIDGMALSGFVHVKCRKNAGGTKALKQMQKLLTKEISGQELTEHEKTLLAKFKEYKDNINLLTGEIFPAQAEIDRLVKMAIPYCEATKLKVGPGSAFWLGYLGNFSQRFIKIASL